jgi:hypothetical protein
MDSVLAFPVPPPPPIFENTNECYECVNCLVYETYIPGATTYDACSDAALALGSSSFAIRGINECFVASPVDFPITNAKVQCRGGNGQWVNQIYNVSYPTGPPSTYMDQGCWNDSNPRAISYAVDNFGYGFTVESCGAAAKNMGATTFALQNGGSGGGSAGGGGQCFIVKGDDDFTVYGASQLPCERLGMPYVNHVYMTS